jgi:hypothetical protein
MATVNRMKYLTQQNDDRMAVAIPNELKQLLIEKSKEEKMNLSQWVKMAIVEKLDRDEDTVV